MATVDHTPKRFKIGTPHVDERIKDDLNLNFDQANLFDLYALVVEIHRNKLHLHNKEFENFIETCIKDKDIPEDFTIDEMISFLSS